MEGCKAGFPKSRNKRQDEDMKIITVTGYKGGVGKSTTALHLAGFFSGLGNTLLVDGDPNRTALEWAKKGKLPFEVISTTQVARSVLGRDWVIFDTPARPEDGDLSEMASSCDLLILPTSPNIVSIRPMLATVAALGTAKYRILLTTVPPHPMKQGTLTQRELRELGYPVFDAMIRRSVLFERAGETGVVVRDLLKQPRSEEAWADYTALGREVLEVLQ
jgi:chromosome partitioning protein